MNKDRIAELKAQHTAFFNSEWTSRGQREDSTVILALIDLAESQDRVIEGIINIPKLPLHVYLDFLKIIETEGLGLPELE